MKNETSISYDPNWQNEYQEMVSTAEDAVAHIQPGQRIFIATGCAQPQELVRALVARSDSLADTEIVDLLTLGEAPYAEAELVARFSVNSFFIGEAVRDIIQEGLGDYTPVFLSDIPRLISTGQISLDVALIQVTPPDENGMCSLGVAVDIVKSAAANARLVIAQVNPQMPRTLGDSMLHVYDLDFLVPVDAPILEVPPPELTEVTREIGEYVASLVEDGSTIELGIGEIPQSVLASLKDKKDLGIHTEMFTDAIIDMIEAGVINGRLKSRDRGKVVASFAVGTRRLYDYIDNNSTFSFNPTEYVNDPFVIAQQHKMVAINVALEVDLTGQVCADSLGERFYSGIGGQVDFNRGAARSQGGKAIIAMPSTARDGEVSRIVCRLSPGAGVVTTRGDVHYVVTEYGVAYLHGKSVQERALALISIAHPKFRAQLMKDAIETKYVRAELAGFGEKIVVGPKSGRTSFLLDDGTQLTIRPVHPTDEPRVREMLYSLSAESIYTRFMSRMRIIPRKQVQEFVYIDHRNEVSIVATIPAADGDDIIAIGGYYLNPHTNRAEVAFVVADEWQSRRIGSFLLKHLADIARRQGIAGFTAEVLRENKAMQEVFNNSGLQVKSELEGDVFTYQLSLE
ncbi:MAG TPA: GNAT family N-acetyltransferase [Candidatus Hydrogenedentes bacterium]|nr:GNAT family N-acetyltransferase [Candidatus Hydrogenedentota bacterium]HPG65859.1 GNAT family N-acetyltransferase [Candidatus Hydrogenedentota bacterium]